jgi:hypothetical protein
MYNVPDTMCGTATLRGPLREDGQVEQILRVEADLYSKDPIVIRCQLNRTADPSVHYNRFLKIYFTSLDEEEHHILTPNNLNPIFESEFHIYPKPLGDIIYYDVYINASTRLERTIIACGADFGMPPQCYTTSTAVVIFRDYDPCDHPTATPETTPTTPSTNSSTSTTKWATASTVTTPTTPPTISSTSESPTTKWDPTSIPTPIKTQTTQTGADIDDTQRVIMNKKEFFPVVGIAILVGIILLVANVIQLWVIIIMRKRRAAAKVQISVTNDVALKQHGIELDHGLESEEDTTIQNNYT